MTDTRPDRERATAPAFADARRPAAIRRSPEEWHVRALEGPGLYRLLRDKYREYPALKLFGDEYEEESGQLRICYEYLRQSERVDLLPDQRWVQLIALDSDGQPESAWRDVLRPATLVAPGWAGVVLGLEVAREVVG